MSVAEATMEALRLMYTGDAKLWTVIGTSLSIAFFALAFATPVAIAIACLLSATRFPGRRIVIGLLHSLLATPTVVVGLVLFLLLSNSGPLGALGLLFTPKAVAIGQFCIALPILTAFSMNALEADFFIVRETAQTLGASRVGSFFTVFNEAKNGLIAAVLAGFGRIVSEVGCALMVGGNIVGHTRTIPTAIALDTGRGLFAEGIALGVILLLLAALASLALAAVHRTRQ